MPTVILSTDAELEMADVARMLRDLADRREAELNATWYGQPEPMGNSGRGYVANLREAAAYHERQAARRR